MNNANNLLSSQANISGNNPNNLMLSGSFNPNPSQNANNQGSAPSNAAPNKPVTEQTSKQILLQNILRKRFHEEQDNSMSNEQDMGLQIDIVPPISSNDRQA